MVYDAVELRADCGLARVAWIAVAVLTVGVFITGLPSEFVRLRTPCGVTQAVLCALGLHACLESKGEE